MTKTHSHGQKGYLISFSIQEMLCKYVQTKHSISIIYVFSQHSSDMFPNTVQEIRESLGASVSFVVPVLNTV